MIILKTAVERYQPFDTPAVRATDGTTSHSTRLTKDVSQVAGYQGERLLTKTVTTPFVLSALRSKAYRSMNGVVTAVSRIIYGAMNRAPTEAKKWATSPHGCPFFIDR